MTELELRSLIDDVLTGANNEVLLDDELNPTDIIIFDQTVPAQGNSNIPIHASVVASVDPATEAIYHNEAIVPPAAIDHNEAIVPTAAIVNNEANLTNNHDSPSNDDLSIEDMQNRCVLKFKK